VHAEMPHREVRHGVAVGEPVGNVIKSLRVQPLGAFRYSMGSFWTLFSVAYLSVSWLTTSMPLP
jgi:hypothetical protein